MMKKGIILALFFSVAMNLNGAFEYLFLNITGRYTQGYTLQIFDIKGKMLCSLEKNESIFLPNAPEYFVVALQNGVELSEQLLSPELYNPLYEPTRIVIAIDFGKIIPRGFNITQHTIREAKELYGKRMHFPK